MAGELDKLKTPYRMGDDGTSILVDREEVYKTRMKLMGKELPLRGAVGFELFNNSDFGMTEFAQKINYQRALQGELTRTILSLAQVKDARVLLVMPEQGLFKQAANKAKASIAVTLRQGQALRPEQVVGMQRLVSSSVPGIAAQDVTVLDQNGVALSRNGLGEGDGEAGTGRLDLKKETENYLSRKAGEVLERAFGPGQAMASVDVVLSADRAQVTTEDLVVPPGRSGAAATGVMVRERETLREAGGTKGDGGEAAPAARSGSSQREVEYAVGRRVEQVVSQPGGIRRIQAVAVVRRSLDAAQQEQVRRVLAAAVGASFERGDTVVVHTLETAPLAAVPAMPEAAPAVATTVPAPPGAGAEVQPWVAGGFLVLLVLVAALLLRTSRARRTAQPLALSEQQRQLALAQGQAWIAAEPSSVGDAR
ncbi:MAG TPA: flagellar basal-body MS-ring/collar protein FliF, partial [Ramlibacter sp.]|nr:flagellar basal-body MS-ring/collar protein FliF [Ramlibacter sp.]